jgi:Flp pilus assembly pilin Flp
MSALRAETVGRLCHLAANDRGAVFIEYVILLTCVTIGCAGAIAGLGTPLLRFFEDQIALLTLPVP